MNDINVEDVLHIANGRRYKILVDEYEECIISPNGGTALFNNASFDSVRLEPGENIAGRMQFEAPSDNGRPIELNLPETLPLLVENLRIKHSIIYA